MMMAGTQQKSKMQQSPQSQVTPSVAARTSNLRGRIISKRNEAQRAALADLLPYLGSEYKFGVNGHDQYLCSEVHHSLVKQKLIEMGWTQTTTFSVLELGPFKLTVISAPAGTLITISEI